MEDNKEKIIESYLREMKEDEISVKKVLQLFGEYVVHLKRYSLLILLFAGLFAGLFFYRAWKTEPTYLADLTFMVNEEESSGASSVAGILGQFVGGGGGEFNMQKISDLTFSRMIMVSSMFEKTKVNGVEDFLANHIFRIYEMNDKWQESPFYIPDFEFKHNQLDSFSVSENYVLKMLFRKVAGDMDNGVPGLLQADYNEITTIIEYKATTLSEELSIAIVEAVYSNLSKFYVDKTIERQLTTYEIISTKVDSIEALLSSKQSQLLRFEDTNRNLFTRTATNEKLRLEREIQMLVIAIGKASENKEIADFTLRSATPFFQVIDKPLMPIAPNMPRKIFNAAIGFILGAVLLSIFLVIRKIYIDFIKASPNDEG